MKLPGIDDYVMDSRYSRYYAELRCSDENCEGRIVTKAEAEYGRVMYEDDDPCPVCGGPMVEAGEADLGSKWDTDERV